MNTLMVGLYWLVNELRVFFLVFISVLLSCLFYGSLLFLIMS